MTSPVYEKTDSDFERASGALTQQLIDIRTEDHFRKRPRWSEQLVEASSVV
jgi:hypothetical protein